MIKDVKIKTKSIFGYTFFKGVSKSISTFWLYLF